MNPEKFFSDILAGINPHRKAEEEEGKADDLDKVMAAMFKALGKGGNKNDHVIGPKCLEIINDMRFGEAAAKGYADYVARLRSLNMIQLYTILQGWATSLVCTCGDPGHKADLVLIHDLMPIVKDEIQKRMLAAKK